MKNDIELGFLDNEVKLREISGVAQLSGIKQGLVKEAQSKSEKEDFKNKPTK